MHVLVVNVGSSSLKLRFLDDRDQVVKSADLPVWVPDISDRDPSRALRDWPPPDVVGHRVVHGGTRFTGPVLVDRAVESALRELTDLAPLHLPKSLAAFDAVRAMLPEVAAVACFDTAFYASRPAEAATYAVPREWQQRYGVRRYGFHGLSHASSASTYGTRFRSAARPVSHRALCPATVRLPAGIGRSAALEV
jgi:acetate kinase